MEQFKLVSDYKPTGDQPQAIDNLVMGIENGLDEQVLLGVTGSGKTFTMANVIARLNRPTLVLAHDDLSHFPEDQSCVADGIDVVHRSNLSNCYQFVILYHGCIGDASVLRGFKIW